MAKKIDRAAERQLGVLFNIGVMRDVTDGQLMERFVTGTGEAAELAFAALIERHGPMVLRVCRGVLRHEEDAQDAFQATFLVLVRKGRGLWVRDSLGPWLHEAAYRAARCARAGRARRRAHERRAAELGTMSPAAEDRVDLEGVLHEEIAGLSERYRRVIVLCDLEGRTHEQVARHLGCPVGTIKSRLARGRERLRERLTRRGLAPAIGLAAAGFSAESARAAVPVALVDRAIRSAVWFVRNAGAGGPAAASVASLANEVSRAIAMTRLFTFASAAVVLGGVAFGVSALTPTGGRVAALGSDGRKIDRGPIQATGARIPTAGRDPGTTDDREAEPEKIKGRWVRTSPNGRDSEETVTMVIEQDGDRPERDLAAGTSAYIFRWTAERQGGESRNRVLLDTTREPKAIDFFPEGQGAPKVCPGIYKLEGDTLTICFRPTNGDRPSEFDPAKPGEVLDVYRREKP